MLESKIDSPFICLKGFAKRPKVQNKRIKCANHIANAINFSYL